MSVFEEIEHDTEKLKESMTILQSMIEEQQDSFDTLEQFIEESKQDIKQGEEELTETPFGYASYIGATLLGGFLYFFLL